MILFPYTAVGKMWELNRVFKFIFFLPLSYNENPGMVLLVVRYQFALILPFCIRPGMYIYCEGIKFFDQLFSQVIFPVRN